MFFPVLLLALLAAVVLLKAILTQKTRFKLLAYITISLVSPLDIVSYAAVNSGFFLHGTDGEENLVENYI